MHPSSLSYGRGHISEHFVPFGVNKGPVRFTDTQWDLSTHDGMKAERTLLRVFLQKCEILESDGGNKTLGPIFQR